MFLGLAGAVGFLGGCGSSGVGKVGGGFASSASTTQVNGALSLGTARALHTATLLPSGEVFVAGGVDSTGNAIGATALLTPTSVIEGPALLNPRVGHTATLLNNGTVLISGGQTSATATSALETTEIYDPLAGSMANGPALTAARSEQIAVEFFEAGAEKVLVAGGTNGVTPLATAEILDVATEKFTALAAPMAEPAAGAHAASLDDGTIVIAGGSGLAGAAGAEIFNPALGTFTATSMTVKRAGGAFAATPSEAVLAGGTSSTGVERTTDMYSVSTRLFSQGALLQDARRDATASVTPGAVIIVGGRNVAADNRVEIFRGATLASSTASGTTTLMTARYGHTATVVGGKVIVVGGFNTSGVPLASVESIDPSAAVTPVATPITTVPAPVLTPAPVKAPVTAPTTTTTSTSSGLGGILSSLFGGSSGSSLLGKVASAGVQTLVTNGFSGGFTGFLSSFAGNLVNQFLGNGSSSTSPTTGSTSTGGLGGLISSLFGGSSTPATPAAPAAPANQVVINYMTPATGPVGSTIVIDGYGVAGSPTIAFSQSQGFFSKILGFFTGNNGTTAGTIQSIAPGLNSGTYDITVTVPSDAQTGTVTVTNAGVSASAGTFTVQ
jgi:hypothetical protein